VSGIGIAAAAGNWTCGKKVMTLLIEKRGNRIETISDVVEAAAGNGRYRMAVMMLLLEKREIKPDVRIWRKRNHRRMSGVGAKRDGSKSLF
jgi:hypothetical protein